MSLLSNSIAWMDSVLLGESCAEPATYTPTGGSATPVYVSFMYGVVEANDGVQGDTSSWRLIVERNTRGGFGGGGVRDVATVVIDASVITAPGYGDTIELAGTVWTVREFMADA